MADRWQQPRRPVGLAAVFSTPLPPVGLAVWQLYGVALASSHHVGALAEAHHHSRGECDGGGHHPLVAQPCRFCMAGVSACAVGVDVDAHGLGSAGAPRPAAWFAPL